MHLLREQSPWAIIMCATLTFSVLACATASGLDTVAGSAQRSILSDSGAIGDLKCLIAKPTLFLMSGIGGSQMSGIHKGNGTACPEILSTTVVWYADKWFLKRNLTCWSHMMSMQYDPATERWRNSSGTELWPDDGFPDGAKQKMYYAALFKHLTATHGYILGKDMFIIPYDWRIGIKGLEQTGGLKHIAQRIEDGVKSNCGQKAIIISHSYGANIMAHMLHKPELKSWRESNVKGWIPVGGPFGGTGSTIWLSILSGDFFKLFPILSNLLPVSVAHKFPLTVVGRSVYNFAFGLPSWGFMMPREFTLGKDHVVVSTPTKNYTVLDQKQLLLDMGDIGGAKLLPKTWNMSDKALAQGPVPGVETYCLYSTSVTTPVTLVFNNSVPHRSVSKRPIEIVTQPGDGVVDLASLRLCSKFAPKDHLIEVDGPLVDHSTILSHPLGLDGLSYILNQMGVKSILQKPTLFGMLKSAFFKSTLFGRRR